MKTYLINLDRDFDRMQHMTAILQRFDIPFERVSAVEGKLLSDEFYDDFCKKIQRTDWPKGGQLGCFMSHFKVWELIANGNEDFALVLEDDLHFSPDIKRLVSEKQWLPSDFDIIRLEVSTNKLLLENPKPIAIGGLNRHVAKLVSTSWCAGAYILSKRCATKLVNIDPKLYQSVDALIFSYEDSPLPSKLNLYQIFPALAIQDKYSDNIAANSGLEKLGFKSSIDVSYSGYLIYESKVFLKKFNLNAIKKIIKGYRRIKYKD